MDREAQRQRRSRSDWLELHLGVTIDKEQVDLVPALLRMLRQGGIGPLEKLDPDAPFVVPLMDGRKLALPTGRIRPTLLALMELLAQGALDADGETIGFARHQAADVAALGAALQLPVSLSSAAPRSTRYLALLV